MREFFAEGWKLVEEFIESISVVGGAYTVKDLGVSRGKRGGKGRRE
jgi:hypothetical protein